MAWAYIFLKIYGKSNNLNAILILFIHLRYPCRYKEEAKPSISHNVISFKVKHLTYTEGAFDIEFHHEKLTLGQWFFSATVRLSWDGWSQLSGLRYCRQCYNLCVTAYALKNAKWQSHKERILFYYLFSTLQLAREGSVESMKAILRKNPSMKNDVQRRKVINTHDESKLSPLHYAARYHHHDMINFLISMGAGQYWCQYQQYYQCSIQYHT